ncbi:MAG: deoxyribose-phosphate aldolase [Rhodobacteraceae bacterium]|nr:deoxyribose-phosphate aldolase [Paracoccaceae bacterium]
MTETTSPSTAAPPLAPGPGAALVPGQAPVRNAGVPLDHGWLAAQRVNEAAVSRRVAGLPGRRGIKGAFQAGWLVRAIGLIDLTTLAGDDTEARVRRLCAKGRAPLRSDLVAGLGLSRPPRVGAICVYHEMVPAALAALQGTGIPVAAVSTGFPAGLSPLATRLAEIEASVAAGAREIDIVISRRHVLRADWAALHEEVAAFRAACGPAHMKAILATGELGPLVNVARASLVCMMAGADFIKTSTGKEGVNATLQVGLVMARAIRDYGAQTGAQVGFKPAGGISTARDALVWMALMHDELGPDWLEPHLFRFGASSLLGDIERQLEHHVTGRYSAAERHGMG